MNFWDWLSITWFVLFLVFWAAGDKTKSFESLVLWNLTMIKADTSTLRKDL